MKGNFMPTNLNTVVRQNLSLILICSIAITAFHLVANLIFKQAYFAANGFWQVVPLTYLSGILSVFILGPARRLLSHLLYVILVSLSSMFLTLNLIWFRHSNIGSGEVLSVLAKNAILTLTFLPIYILPLLCSTTLFWFLLRYATQRKLI
jgi:hypothetical protein